MPCLRNTNSQRKNRRVPSPSPYPSSRSPSVSRSTPAPSESRSSTDKPRSSKKPRTQSSSQSQSQAQSHARKREEGYIKRPSNAFILFRTDFVTQGRIPSSLESHSQNLSRIAGTVWKSMPEEEKAPWKRKADEVKEEHKKMFPKYEYHPTDSYALRGRRKVVKGRGERELGEAKWKCKVVALLVKNGTKGEILENVVSGIEKRKPRSVSIGKEKETGKTIIRDESTFPARDFYLDEEGKLVPVLPSLARFEEDPPICASPPPEEEGDEDRYKRLSGTLGDSIVEVSRFDRERIKGSRKGLRSHSESRTFDEEEPANSVSPSVSALSPPTSEARELTLRQSFEHPFTYIPPGNELESELFPSTDFAFPPASPTSTQSHAAADIGGIRNLDQIPELNSGSSSSPCPKKVALPSIIPPPDLSPFPKGPGRAPKLIIETWNGLRMPSRDFPGALHVPDKPRSSAISTVAPTASDIGPESSGKGSAMYDRSLLYTRDSGGGGSYPASSSAFRSPEPDSASLISSSFRSSSLRSGSNDKEDAEQKRKDSTFLPVRHPGLRQSQSQLSSRSSRGHRDEAETWSPRQVDPHPHPRLRPRLSEVVMARRRSARKPESKIDSDRSVVGSLSPRSLSESD